MCTDPEVFSKAICMSPAFKVDDIDYVKDVLAYHGPRKDLFFYVYNGGVGLENKLMPGIDDMLDALESRVFEQGKNVIWSRNASASHNETAWAHCFPEALLNCMKWEDK